MVEVFREVKRILTADGTLWLNLGDSYATGTTASRQDSPTSGVGANHSGAQNSVPRIGTPAGLKTKDLVGIPWRVAFALQADGWYLRSDIIWHKPNPMPESVRDRPTKSHEYLFLLTKSPRYYYDHNAVREPLSEATKKRDLTPRGRSQNGGGSEKSMAGYSYTPELGNMASNPEGRNRRDVWTINTKPFKGAHFAVMPEALVEPCVSAGSAEGDTVLDPFTGSGTVAVVANRHGRNFVGTELNPKYAEIAKERITNASPMFNEVQVH
jgi:DNA modification methylase